MTFQESGLHFHFTPTQWQVMKYDGHQYFKTLSGAGLKGVDFIGIYQQNQLVFFEIKNFRAYPADSKGTFYLFEDSELFIENIHDKLEDTLTAIKVIIKYLNRKFWYRYFLKLEASIPARFFYKQDWYFWHQIYTLWNSKATKTYVLWLEVDAKYSTQENDNFKATLEKKLKEAIKSHNFHTVISNIKSPIYKESLHVKKGT